MQFFQSPDTSFALDQNMFPKTLYCLKTFQSNCTTEEIKYQKYAF